MNNKLYPRTGRLGAAILALGCVAPPAHAGDQIKEKVFTGSVIEAVDPAQEQTFAVLDQSFIRYDVFTLDGPAIQSFVRQQGDFSDVTLKLGDAYAWTLHLQRRDIRSADYKLTAATENGVVEYPRSETITYRGYLNNDPSDIIRVNIYDGRLSGLIRIAGEDYFIEPVSRLSGLAGDDLVVVYRARDFKWDADVRCAVTEMHSAIGDAEGSASRGSGPESPLACALAEIAVAADYSMVQQFGSVTGVENEVTAILNLVTSKYEEVPPEISYNLVQIFVSNCSSCDPWTTSTGSSALLDSFTSWGPSGFSNIHDVASLWTNRNLDNNGVIGLAWVGTICGNSRYNILEHYFSTQGGNMVDQTHELGHNWNAQHTASNSTYIMSPTIGTTNTQWDATTTNSIVNHKNSRSCLQSSCSLAPVANFTASISSCNGVVQFTDQSTNSPTSWQWEFGDGGTSSQQNPSYTYASSGTYTVKLTATNSIGNDIELKTGFVAISLAAKPTVTDGCNSTPGNVTMSSSAANGGSLEWYTAASGGSLVYTGSTYTTSLSTSTAFYVQEVVPGAQYKVGPVTNTQIGGGGNFTGNDLRGIFFDVLKPFRLKTVKVYAGAAGNRTIEVLSGSDTGPVVASKVVNIPSGESRITLNFDLTNGTDYYIKVTGSLVDLYRNNTGSPAYPYTVSNVVRLTRCNVAGSELLYYYFFYDWDIEEPGCTSPRSQVWGYIPCTGMDEAGSSDVRIYPNPSHGELFVTFSNRAVQPVSIRVMNALGAVVHSRDARTAAGRFGFDMSGLPAGVYIVRVLNGEAQSSHRVMVTQ